MKKFFSITTLLTYFLCHLLEATELKPWSGNLYSSEIRASCLLQQFESLDTSCGKIKRPEFDAFYELGFLSVPREKVNLELELSASNTRHRVFGMNAFRVTGRYFFFDDVALEDPVALAAGVTFSKIFHAARRNVATFDHGGVAAEAHVAVGKELSCGQYWTSRSWGVLGLGIADVGSPWLRANLACEFNWWEMHQLKVFADSIWGFGGNRLTVRPDFHGYGSVDYQAVDVGLRYGMRLDCDDLMLSLAYAYRCYAKNCPRNVNLIKLELLYPFGF